MPAQFDLVIRNGCVIDGTGARGEIADVAIADDRVVAVDRIPAGRGEREIDVAGKTVAPGFIDAHTHDDRALLVMPDMAAKASQGVTTVVIGQDGRHSKKFDEAKPGQISRQMEYIGSNGAGSNVGFLMGHDNIRMMVMGDDYKRFSTPAESAYRRCGQNLKT